MDKWKTICSQALLDTKWVKVRKDAVELPNGQHIDDFYAITINEAAAIVALDDYGNIILKKEYRYCFGRDLIEIPAGGFERGEEGLEVIGRTVESSAKLTNYMHIYFADHCRKVSGQHLDATEEIEVLVMPLEQAVSMVMDNEICCNSSAHGILWAARKYGI